MKSKQANVLQAKVLPIVVYSIMEALNEVFLLHLSSVEDILMTTTLADYEQARRATVTTMLLRRAHGMAQGAR